MLFACAGVVLAQPAGSDAGTDLSFLEAGDPIPGRYIVVFERSVEDPGAQAERFSRRFGLEVLHVYRHALEGFNAEISGEDVDVLRSVPAVDFVTRDRVAEASAQATPPGIRGIDADVSSTRAGNGSGEVDADVAILDSGIYKHKDLNVTGGADCSGRDTGSWGTATATARTWPGLPPPGTTAPGSSGWPPAHA
jgi:subtilisin